jgi:hypothetical protein
MTRRTWTILAAAGLAVLLAVAGTIVATGLGDDDAGGPPTGEQNVLRIEPAKDAVACGEIAPIYVYLDDLAPRESPRQAGVSYGVIAFEYLLRYDPDVVRIAKPIDVELNQALSEEDADGDGIARSFLLATNIDDGNGRALIGTSSLVSTSQSVEDNFEEGIDPVAKGEPLLLMTIRLTTVGEGAAGLTIETEDVPGTLFAEPGLYDPSNNRYEPVVVQQTDVTVESGDCATGPFATPRPTLGRTDTPFVAPSPTLRLWRTVAPTDAPRVGRDDCPEEWASFADPMTKYSLCYPKNMAAQVSDGALYLTNARTPEGTTPELISFIASTEAESLYAPGLEPEEQCSEFTDPSDGRQQHVERIQIMESDVAVCIVEDMNVTLQGEVPLGSEYLRFRFFYTSPDVTGDYELGYEILRTLAPGQ